MLQHLPEIGLKVLLKIINNSINKTEIPQSWRTHIVIPILKNKKILKMQIHIDQLHYYHVWGKPWN